MEPRRALRDGSGCVWVHADPAQPGRVGDAVELVGTPTRAGPVTVLTEAWVNTKGTAPEQPSRPVELTTLGSAGADAMDVTTDGRVVFDVAVR